MAILILEDDANLIRSLTAGLQDVGYEVASASTLLEAEKILDSKSITLIVADYVINNESGLDVIKLLDHYEVKPPIVIITSFATKDLAIESLNKGIFKFIEKPLKYSNFLNVVKESEEEFMRRCGKIVFYEDNIKLDPVKRVISVNDNNAQLTEVEYKILSQLVKKKKLWVSKNFLNEVIWDGREHSSRNVIDTHISNIRKKVPFLSKYIKSQRGRGYQLDYEPR